ncbi:MAG: hypothetical protein HON23_06270 [Rickettsiales bacterium]|jgi:hypothetical protein|nr:hypothetical protein [Rickettsiales bacterium]
MKLAKKSIMDYAIDKVKKVDYPLYCIFANHKFACEIFTIYNLHLELSQIPITSNNLETRQIRSNWWLNSLAEIKNPNNKTQHPILSLISEYFGHNTEILKEFKQLVILREKENELYGFKTKALFNQYVEATNLSIWHLIYQMLNQCKLTRDKKELLKKFSIGIKYVNIVESLYYRNYNNHFCISEELIVQFKDSTALEKQERIFQECYAIANKNLSEFISLGKANKDLKSFVLYSKINKSRLHLLQKRYKNTTDNIPPYMTKISVFLKIKIFDKPIWT